MRALPVDDWKRILDRLAEVGVPHVIFTGGEATVYKGLTELIAHADGAGMMTGLNSNGRRLKDKRYVEKLADAGLDHIQITLESHRAEVHDAMVGAKAWAECVEGVREPDAGRIRVLGEDPGIRSTGLLNRIGVQKIGHGLILRSTRMRSSTLSGRRTDEFAIGVPN